jgi:hypothetical protein
LTRSGRRIKDEFRISPLSLYVTLPPGVSLLMQVPREVRMIASERRPLHPCGSTTSERLSLPDVNGMTGSIVSCPALPEARTHIRLAAATIMPLDADERKEHARNWH